MPFLQRTRNNKTQKDGGSVVENGPPSQDTERYIGSVAEKAFEFLCLVFLSWVDSIKLPTLRDVLGESKKLAWIAAIYHCKLIWRTRWWTLSMRVCVCACVQVCMRGCLSLYVVTAIPLVDIEYTCVCVCACVSVCVSAYHYRLIQKTRWWTVCVSVSVCLCVCVCLSVSV